MRILVLLTLSISLFNGCSASPIVTQTQSVLPVKHKLTAFRFKCTFDTWPQIRRGESDDKKLVIIHDQCFSA